MLRPCLRPARCILGNASRNPRRSNPFRGRAAGVPGQVLARGRRSLRRHLGQHVHHGRALPESTPTCMPSRPCSPLRPSLATRRGSGAPNASVGSSRTTPAPTVARIPEHSNHQPATDLELNRDQPDHPFKPFGATVGHGLEWARLMLHLQAAIGGGDGWLLDAAEEPVPPRGRRRVVRRRRSRLRLHDGLGRLPGCPRPDALGCGGGDQCRRDVVPQDWRPGIQPVGIEPRRDYAGTYLLDHRHGSWRHQLDASNVPADTVWAGKARPLPRSPGDVDSLAAVVPDDRDRPSV